MSPIAQQHMIFGAMCVDEPFRNALFAEAATDDQKSAQINQLLIDYAAAHDVPLTAGERTALVQNVMNVVRATAPCRQVALVAFAAAKAAACPCWPC